MNEKYLETIVQYLIKIVNNNSVSDKGIVEKLDEVVDAVSNIKISAESVNLNTDELENKLDSIYSSLSNINEDINNIKIKQHYLNPTHLGIVSEGDTEFGKNVVLCNITDNNITVTATGADDTTPQSIVLTPGWNPVIVKAVSGATANTLIYGW